MEGGTRLTVEDGFGFTDYTLDVHRRLFHLCCDKQASCQYQVRVCLAITVLEVESLKVDGSSRNRDLTE
jgi:hypothetical protein